jgi:hypothetical protein|tara:strand:- start:357 stop:794 length:438 start_codon:yes stop_codon:yes gene_type:complete
MATDNRGFWDTIGGLGSALTGGGSGSAARLSIERLEKLYERFNTPTLNGQPNPSYNPTVASDIKALIDEKTAKVEADIWEGAKQPGTPEGMIGSSTAGSGWSMGKYAPTQVVQKELMPQRILPREDEDVFVRGSLFGMAPYRWYS